MKLPIKKINIYHYIILSLVLIFFITSNVMANIPADNIIKVGTYPNNPLLFKNSEGEIEGYFIDIINYIAKKENWNVQYVHNTWDIGLEKLKNNELDMMLGIAHTEERDKIYDYPQNNFITTWGQIYTQKGNNILSILDLNNKVIGVLKNDIYYIGNVGLKKIIHKFDVECEFQEFNNYTKILTAIEKKDINAGLIPRLYGITKGREYNVNKCPVVINPIGLTVATPEDNNLNMLNTIDQYISRLKKEDNSFYYQNCEKWVTINKAEEMPFSLKLGMLLIYITFFLSVVIFSFIKRQVQIKTHQLRKKEKQLEENKNKITELHKVAIKMKQLNSTQEIYQLSVDAAKNILAFNFCVLKIYKHNKLKAVATSSSCKYLKLKSKIDHLSISKFSFPIDDIGVFECFINGYNELNDKQKEITQLLISHIASSLRRLQSEEKIKYISFHDRLTGLYNREYIEEELKRLDSERQIPLSIIMGDINGLKLINDTFGHQKGDKLIKSMAKILKDSTRHEDIIGRWGGDEFLIVLPRTTKNQALEILNRIKKHCQQNNFNQSKLDIPISIALGVATKSNKYDDNEKIIEKADNHMYTDKINQGQKNKNKMIAAMLKNLKNKNYEKFTHIKQVKKISHLIGKKMNLNKKRLALLDRAAYLHDIGMLAINDEILNKNAELSIKEWKKIKTHPEIGCRITDITERYSNISDIILNHHENWDGSGYPNGIKKENIPLCARIIRIADAFDVMLHNQVYKEKITKQEAIEELKSKSGIEFDPKLVSIFINQVLPNLDITP